MSNEMKMASAYHVAGCIGLIALKHNDEDAVEKAVKIIRNDRCAVLDVVAEVISSESHRCGLTHAHLDGLRGLKKKLSVQKNVTVSFTEEDVKEYLDHRIIHWRMCDATPGMAEHYVDAFQSVRVSLFGETLSEEEITPGDPCDQERDTK